MGQLSPIPTKATVDLAWKRYCDLQLAVQADPLTRQDPAAIRAAERAHERFCNLYNQWVGR